jgi:hypothetical protein
MCTFQLAQILSDSDCFGTSAALTAVIFHPQNSASHMAVSYYAGVDEISSLRTAIWNSDSCERKI